tara:strand:+ start:216 stop:809 length:594 start_codon:yes stop_codon:yes gene_type:complete
MKLEELNKMFNDFGKFMVTQSKENLKTEKKGSGPLYDSITYDIDDSNGKFEFSFSMQEYGEFQDKGVKGADPSKLSPNAKLTGQQAPNSPYRFGSGTKKGTFKDFVRSVSAWAQIKNIRLRQYTYKDGKKKSTGKFAKGNYESIGYVIAKNIYNRGLKPSFFYTKPFNKAFEKLPDELFESFAVDIEQGLIEQINKK